MNGHRTRVIFKMCEESKPNFMNSIINNLGLKKFNIMSKRGIYRWAKRNWIKYGIKDKWEK